MLQSDLYMTHKISGCDLDWSEAPHDLNASFFGGQTRMLH